MRSHYRPPKFPAEHRHVRRPRQMLPTQWHNFSIASSRRPASSSRRREKSCRPAATGRPLLRRRMPCWTASQAAPAGIGGDVAGGEKPSRTLRLRADYRRRHRSAGRANAHLYPCRRGGVRSYRFTVWFACRHLLKRRLAGAAPMLELGRTCEVGGRRRRLGSASSCLVAGEAADDRRPLG